MKATKQELELIEGYIPSEGVGSDRLDGFSDDEIIDFAKQYHNVCV